MSDIVIKTKEEWQLTRLITLALDKLMALRRNPQYLSEKQSQALTESIKRDGFLAPIIVRKHDDKYEILSGNHRVISSREAGLTEIPCVLVEDCDDARAARIAVNMNTVHGDPIAELLAPFLSGLDDSVLETIHLDDKLILEMANFDAILSSRLDELKLPDVLDSDSVQGAIPNCVCKCGHRHVASARKASK